MVEAMPTVLDGHVGYSPARSCTVISIIDCNFDTTASGSFLGILPYVVLYRNPSPLLSLQILRVSLYLASHGFQASVSSRSSSRVFLRPHIDFQLSLFVGLRHPFSNSPEPWPCSHTGHPQGLYPRNEPNSSYPYSEQVSQIRVGKWREMGHAP